MKRLEGPEYQNIKDLKNHSCQNTREMRGSRQVDWQIGERDYKKVKERAKSKVEVGKHQQGQQGQIFFI